MAIRKLCYDPTAHHHNSQLGLKDMMTGLGFHEIDLHYKQDIDNSNNNWWVKLGFLSCHGFCGWDIFTWSWMYSKYGLKDELLLGI